jgi:ribonuclease D
MSSVNPIEWITTGDGVAQLVSRCRKIGRFALDTEADSFHSYFHQVCLIQVSVDGLNAILDPIELNAADLEPLWEISAEPAIGVTMHGADYDIRILDRDFGARIGGLVDTQIMAQLLGEPQTGLAALVAKELGYQVDKRYQRANWKVRPLPQSMLEYAAQDTAVLETLSKKLWSRLDELGRHSWAEEEFKKLEQVRHTPAEPDPLAFERIKGARNLEGKARDRLHSLYLWREDRAKRLDTPPFKILGNSPMVALAESVPRSVAELSAVSGVGPRLARRLGKRLLAVLRNPSRAPGKATRKAFFRPDAKQRRLVKKLIDHLDDQSEDLGLARGVLCPKAIVEAVAYRSPYPRELAELEECGLVGWRLNLLGTSFMTILKESE